MNGGLRAGLIVVFVLAGLIFFYLQYTQSSKPQPQKIYWGYKLKPGKDIKSFLCKANTFYTFKSQHGFSYIQIPGMEKYNVGNYKFVVKFNQDTKLTMDCYIKGVWFKDGYLDIWEGKKEGYPRLYYLTTDEYTETLCKVQKGMRLTMPRMDDLYYLGYFKNGVLKGEVLVKNDDGYYFQFWDEYEIKIKAAEIPFLTFLNYELQEEKFKFNNIDFGPAYFLKPGDIITTPIWFDKGDYFWFEGDYIDKLLFSQGDGEWEEFELKPVVYNARVVERDGYLKVKCIKPCIFNDIQIKRRKYWSFILQPNEIKEIKVYTGDKLQFYSDSRYYVNNQLLDGGETYINTVGQDGFIEFKGSLVNDPIYISVIQRRGY